LLHPKLYLAVNTPHYHNILGGLRAYFKDMVGLITIYNGQVRVVFDPKKLRAHVCSLYFIPPTRSYVVKYDFCNPCSKRQVLQGSNAYYMTIGTISSQCGYACNNYQSHDGTASYLNKCIDQCDCLILLGRRTKASIVPYVCPPQCNPDDRCLCFEKEGRSSPILSYKLVLNLRKRT